MERIRCEHCAVFAACVIRDLPLDRLDEFRACRINGIYRRREVVFLEGMPAEGLYLLCHGAVKLYQADRFGSEYILGVAAPGEVLNEVPLDSRETHAISAEVLADAQICFVPQDRLVRLIRRHPMAGVRLIGALGRSLGAARRRVRALALRSTEPDGIAAEGGGTGFATAT